MADTSSYRVPAGNPIAEDDPFAELTRIMGFDPREKVVRQPEPAEPDFGIDLERELMGDFSSDQDNEPVAVAREPEPMAQQSAPEPVAVEPRTFAPEPEFESLPEPDFASSEMFAEPAAEREPEPDLVAAEEPADPFADFDLAFEEAEAAAPAQVAHHEAAEAGADLSDAAYDEDVERAFAALEAWEHGRISRGAAEMPVLDERQIAGFAAPAVEEPSAHDEIAPVAADESDAAEDFAPELFALEADAVADDVQAENPIEFDDLDFDLASDEVFAAEAEAEVQAEDESVETSADERERFTAEEGWTDEVTVSLDEPQVLQAFTQESAAVSATEDDFSDADFAVELDDAQAAAVVATGGEQPAVEDDFEQELFDLLGGTPAAYAETAFANSEWQEPTVAAEAPVEAAQEIDEVAPAVAAPVEPESDQQWQDAVDEFEAELAAQNEAESEEAAPVVETVPAVAAAWQYQPAQAYGAPAYSQPEQVVAPVQEPEAEQSTEIAHAGEPGEADAEIEDIDLLDLQLDDFELTDEPATEPTAADEALVAAAMTAASQTNTDPADEPSATPDTEPEAMQPYNERAFDAALSDELALASDDHRNWQQRQHDDPFAFTPVSQSQAANYAPRQRPVVNAPAMHADVPDIETVDFVDSRVAHSEELDLPEVDYGHEQQPVAQFDDFDAEFASAFNALNEEQQPQAAGQVQEQPRQAAGQTWDDNFDWGVAGAAGATATAASASSLSRAGLYEPQEEEEYYQEQAQRTQRYRKPAFSRKMMVGAAVAALVLIGGVVFVAMPGSPIGSGEPAVLRADSDPLKVRPENPGGATVPNQDNVVYDRVGTSQPLATPTQERLITSAEEPVDIAAGEDEEGPMAGLSALDDEGEMVGSEDEDVIAKAEDRITPDQADQTADIPQEMVAVAPRKVRTMMVRSDGTLVPREEASAEPMTLASAAEAAIEPEPTVVAPAAAAPRLPEPAPVAAAPTPAPVAQQPVAAAPQPAPAAPAPAPQVAAVQQPAAGAVQVVDQAAAPAGWSVQIASQPSEAGAQSTYQDLARRYSSVLNGRGVNIVKAEIAGKGTYYRVRIPASSRSDANSICANFKSAGGSCFVSQ